MLFVNRFIKARQLHYSLLVLVVAILSNIPTTVQGQSKKIDSLQKLLASYPTRDTQYVNLLNATGFANYTFAPEKTSKYGQQALKLGQKIGFDKGIADAYNTLGVGKLVKGKYAEAISYYKKALTFYKKIKNHDKVARLQFNLGAVAGAQANYDKAIGYYLQSITYFKSTQDQKALAGCYNNIGVIYKRRGELNEASKYYQLALEGYQAINNLPGVARGYLNLGRISQTSKKYQEALAYFDKALKITQKTGNKKAFAICYHNIGEIKALLNQHQEAIVYYEKSIKIEKALGNPADMAQTYNYLAESHRQLQAYTQAARFLKLSQALSQKSGSRDELKDSYLFRSRLDSSQGQYKEAYLSFQKYSLLKDSLFNKEKSKQIAQMKTQFETEQKESKILLLEEQKNNQQHVINRQNLLLGIIGLGLFSALALAFALYRFYRVKKRNNDQLKVLNNELNQQQDEIITQRDFIEQQRNRLQTQNHSITQSLKAAHHLQQATLPNEDNICATLPQHFIIYQPKDIVSGDFYWVEKVANTTFVALGDGTGHGVPGAFMALIATTLLNRIIKDLRTTNPADILNMMHQEVRNILRQQDNNNQNGMDIGICAIQAGESSKLKVRFAGARRPLLFLPPGNQEVEEFKPNRKSIGGFSKNDDAFEQISAELPSQTTFYMLTDGYTDQNNTNRQRLGQVPFKEMLAKIYYQPFAQQKETLQQHLDEHMKDTEQRDDIAVMGWCMG